LAAPPAVDLDPANAGGISPDISVGFVEGSEPVRIAPNAGVSDPDGDLLDEMVLELDPAGGTDRLDAAAGENGIAANWDGGALRLVGPASPAAFQGVLRTVTFFAEGADLDSTPREISITAADGVETSAPVTARVRVQTVNDRPELDLNPAAEGRGNVVDLPAASGSVLPAPNAVLSDPDDVFLESASVERIFGAAEDDLSVDAAGTGLTVESVDGELRLTGTAEISVYQSVLRSLRLRPADAENDRVFAVTVSDGSRKSRVSLAIAALDPSDPPEVVTATFTENGDPVAVAGGGATLTDPSGNGFTALRVTFRNAQPGDRLDADTSGTAVMKEYSGGVLRLTGADDAAAYTQILRSVSFFNPSDTPSTALRVLSFQVESGELASPIATTVLSVLPVNDAPELSLPGPQLTPQNVPLLFSRVENNPISVADPDAGTGTVALSLFVPRGVLSAGAGNGAELSGVGTNELEVAGTVDAVNTALNGLRYDPQPDWHGVLFLTVTADDRGHSGAPGPAFDQESVEITVAVPTAPNPPVADAGPDQRADEGAFVALDGGNSFAREGILTGYSWEQTAGPAVTLNGVDTATPDFSAPEVGADTVLLFRLTVVDSQGESDADEVAVTVENIDVPGPGAPDLTVEEGQTAVLPAGAAVDGSVGVRWEQISGPNAPLSDPNTAQPTFVAPAAGPEGERLVFQRTVFRESGDPMVNEVAVGVRDNGIVGFPAEALTYRAANGAAMGIHVANGELVRLDPVDPAGIDDRRGRPLDFPIGVTGLEIRVPGSGRRASITFFLPAPADPEDRWFKHDPSVGWYDFGAAFSPDRTRVTLEIGDGSRGDVDGIANGRIVDPSGLGTPSGLPPSPGLDNEGDGDGGGCFLGVMEAVR
jgi:hypothetical protein